MAYYYLIKVSHIFSRWRVIFFVDVLVSSRHKLLLAQNLQFLGLHMLKEHNFIFERVNETLIWCMRPTWFWEKSPLCTLYTMI